MTEVSARSNEDVDFPDLSADVGLLSSISAKVLNTILMSILLIPAVSFADSHAYNLAPTITIENSRYIVKHHHDWEQWSILDDLFKDINGRDVYFTSKNTISYLEVLIRGSQKTVFKKPVPALTRIWISDDSKYIVGWSDIKISNPYQLVVFNIEGKLLF